MLPSTVYTSPAAAHTSVFAAVFVIVASTARPKAYRSTTETDQAPIARSGPSGLRKRNTQRIVTLLVGGQRAQAHGANLWPCTPAVGSVLRKDDGGGVPRELALSQRPQLLQAADPWVG
jgi:hypothetical protein